MARPLSRLTELHLDGIAVDAAVVAVEDLGDVGIADLGDGVAGNDPERRRLVPAAVELARVRVRELGVRRLERPAVLERLAFALLAEDLPDGHRPTRPPQGRRRAPRPSPRATCAGTRVARRSSGRGR